MGAIQFIENLDRTTLTISDSEFESNVEMAVSAIAERHREEVPLSERPLGTKKPASSEVEMVAHPLTHPAEPAEKGLDSGIAMTGLLQTMQKPLTSMGRIFSEEKPTSQHSLKGIKLGDTPRLDSSPSTGLSPVVFQPTQDSSDGRRTPDAILDTSNNFTTQAATSIGNDIRVRQTASEVAQVQRLRRNEHNDVVELVSPNVNLSHAHTFRSSTLVNMFPGLDKDLIEDVVRIKQGRLEKNFSYCVN